MKRLLAAAVAAALSGSSAAADFTVYGNLDLGFAFHTLSTKSFDGTVNRTRGFSMENGYSSPSDIVLRGTEDFGNGLRVSFFLDSAFKADHGVLGQGGRLFGREASITFSGDFGRVSIGRMGGVGAHAGQYDLVYGKCDAFDGFDNRLGGLADSERYDNMLTYQTPKAGGVQATVQYSFQKNTVIENMADEGTSKANRYASFALTGEFGDMTLVGAYEFHNYDSITRPGVSDGHVVYLGGNYDLGVTKLFGLGQVFEGLRFGQYHFFTAADSTGTPYIDLSDKGTKGYGLHIGAKTPVMSGMLTTAVYYSDAKNEQFANTNEDMDLRCATFSMRYVYPLSKRTRLFCGTGYSDLRYSKSDGSIHQHQTQTYMGIAHAW